MAGVHRWKLWACLGLSLTGGWIPEAHAQAPAPVPAQKGAVIKPPSHLDPGMQVKPRPRAALPTPVVKPSPGTVPK